jgi:hypothetical protein
VEDAYKVFFTNYRLEMDKKAASPSVHASTGTGSCYSGSRSRSILAATKTTIKSFAIEFQQPGKLLQRPGLFHNKFQKQAEL